MPIGTSRIGSPHPDADTALRHLVTQAIRACPKSREQVADGLSIRLSQRITVHMLNDFTSRAKKRARFPASFIEAFCEVTGNDDLRLFFLSGRQRRLLELGEQAEQLVLAASRKRKK